MTDDTLKPWERQPGETQRAYEWFRAWLETDPPKSRSFLATYRATTGRSEVKSLPGYFRDWITKNRWAERARQYDQFLNRQREREANAQRLERAKLWEGRREQVADEGWELAQALIEKSKEILKTPTFQQKVTREIEAPDGRTIVQQITVEPGRFSIRDAGRMIQIADQLRRLSADMATEIIENVTPESQAAAKFRRAKEAFEESMDFYPEIQNRERADVIAQAFGVSAVDLLEEFESSSNNAITASDAIQ